MATPIDVVVFKCCKICPTENQWNSALLNWPKNPNFGCLSSCHYCMDLAQNLPGPAPKIWLTLYQISSKSVHFQQSDSRTREDRFFAPTEYLHDRLFEPMMVS